MAGGEGEQEVEANWEALRGDLRLSKMTITRPRPPLQFEIPLCRKVTAYKSGRGPPPPRVDLQLPHDSDAFIIDKLILPPGPFTQPNDPRQRRAYYVVGWPDLPAARPVIDATKILDYVSPRTLEDWEYQDALRREAEEEAASRAKEEARAAAAAAAAAQSQGAAAPQFTLSGRIKKKPGRKPKNAKLLEARAPTPQLDSEQEAVLARKKNGPSLSTPQRSRIAQLDAEMEMQEEGVDSMDEGLDEAMEVQRQLEYDALRTGAGVTDVNMAIESDGVDLQTANGAASGVASGAESSSRASSRRPGLPSLRPLRLSPPRFEAGPSKVVSQTATGSKATPKAAPRHVSTGPPRPNHPSAKRQTAIPATGANNPSQGQYSKPVSTTPIPLPPRGPPSWSTQRSGSLVPVPPTPYRPAPAPIVSRTPAFRAGPPQNANNVAVTEAEDARTPSSSAQPPPVFCSNGGGFTPTNSNFAPAGGYFSTSAKPPADDSATGGERGAMGTPAGTQVKRGVKKKAPMMPKLVPRPAPDPAEENPAAAEPEEFVVKRLEGFQFVDGVRWFKVRWEGDWPADQNPTYEPEGNISPFLVAKYLQRRERREAEKKAVGDKRRGGDTGSSATASAAGGGGGGSSKARGRHKKQTSLAQWAANYSSVSEAFEGQAELDATTHSQDNGSGAAAGGNDGGGGGGPRAEEEEDDGADELLVVDRDRERAAAEKRSSLGAQFAAQIARMGAARRDDY